MRIGIVDADLVGRPKHRFPNLASMKIAEHHKVRGDDVNLLLGYDNLENYDTVYVSKVFTDTPVPDGIIDRGNVVYGGTGFYFDSAPNLPIEVEHCMPDYHLYDTWVQEQMASGKKRAEFKFYLDYSIGFLTRGCFRKCSFCVNKKYSKVLTHSLLSEFYDPKRKKIALLDDNFLGTGDWRPLLTELISTGKSFTFRQGLDVRLLTKEKCELLFSAKYDGKYIFAFDDIEDRELIENKLKLIRSVTDTNNIRFYVLCGFKDTDEKDIADTFERIKILMKYKCLPYIMRYQSETEKPYLYSENRGMYINLATWCNQPHIFTKLSFWEFCEKDESRGSKSTMRYTKGFAQRHPDIANKYFRMKWGQVQ